jgi:hypothetical protein
LNQSDPTDHALAAIASILDQPDSAREPDKAVAEEKPLAPAPVEADGYCKIGPGPMAAIRFKWRVRRDEHGDDRGKLGADRQWADDPGSCNKVCRRPGERGAAQVRAAEK